MALTAHTPKHHRLHYLRVLKSAKQNGLTWEFIHFYKRARRQGDNVMEATNYAMCEWDL